MTTRLFPAAILGTYRDVRAYTDDDRTTLLLAGQERVHDRLCELLASGTIAASQVQRQYGALMAEIGVV